MQRGNLDDLSAFLIVAREGSFTKAAAKLGVSQSALSYTIKELEARLKLRLLTRTTRSVSPTAAGERLLRNAGPRIEEIEAELAALSELREKPSGTIRITATEYATNAVLLPKLAMLLREYPDIKVEIICDYGMTDIVTQRFDAGVRDGEQAAKDMIAVRIGPDARMVVVGAPSYFRNRSEPKKPPELVEHNCINLRLPTHGGLYAWEFEKGSRELKVRVEGQLIFNTATQMLHAALELSTVIGLVSTYGIPAIDRECVTDHEACGGTAKPKNRICNLLGATKATDGYVFQHRIKRVSLSGHHLVEHRGMDDARTYCIDTNAPCGIVQSRAFGESKHAVFGGLVCSALGTAYQSSN